MASQLTSYLWDHWPCVRVGCAWCRRPEPLGCLAGSGEGVPWYGCGLKWIREARNADPQGWFHAPSLSLEYSQLCLVEWTAARSIGAVAPQQP